MTLLICWVVFPVVLAVVATGCGLLVRSVCGTDVPGPLLPAVGLALVVVVGEFLTLADATAELTAPVAVALAAVGFSVDETWRRRPRGAAPVVAALAVFAVFAAPIVLSGQATFAGYLRLDDTATWMALTDRIMDHGRSLSGLPPSTYEAVLSFNLGSGYPVGAFLPLGIGHVLTGQDVAWLIQPYMAFLAALLALALWTLLEALVRSRWLRAVAAFLAAQSALLYGYYLWGGIKEMSAAPLLAAFAALAGLAIRERFAARAILPLALVGGAFVGIESGGGVIWLAPALLVAAAISLQGRGVAPTLRTGLLFAAVLAVLSIPVLAVGGFLPPTSSPLTSSTALGNLFHPLSKLQLFGVWPAGDFRNDPGDLTTTRILIVVVGAAAVGGLYAAMRARAWSVLLYAGGTVVAGLVIALAGSPWVGAKALAIASPAIPFAAATAGAILWSLGRRVEGAVLLAAIAAGILWSNTLAYRDVNLAPRAQLAELETIGDRIAGQGPTLMTEYQPYGVRHFLRDAAPEGASELRRRLDPLLGGQLLRKGLTADTDRFQLGSITQYRTLVLRRTPFQSRPPSPYRLIWRGHYYEVWQRPPPEPTNVIAHLGLGSATDPAGIPACAAVMRLAREAGAAGKLAAVPRDPVIAIGLHHTRHPTAWESPAYASALLPVSPGTITTRVRVAQPGDYQVWLGGSVRPQVDLYVDGSRRNSVRHQIENDGEYVELGTANLAPGLHTFAIRFHGADLHPGSGGSPPPIGPLVLAPQDFGDTHVLYFAPRRARELCGRRWDWIEAFR